MNKRLILLIVTLLPFVFLYFIDRSLWMKRGVTNHVIWENVSGNRIRGDFIDIPPDVTFEGNTMILEYSKRGIDTFYSRFGGEPIIRDYRNIPNDTLILKSQYFKTMWLKDPKTGKNGVYRKKGGSKSRLLWFDI